MGKNIKNLGRELFFGDKKLNNTEKSRYTLHYIILIAFDVICLFFGIKNLYYSAYIPYRRKFEFFLPNNGNMPPNFFRTIYFNHFNNKVL